MQKTTVIIVSVVVALAVIGTVVALLNNKRAKQQAATSTTDTASTITVPSIDPATEEKTTLVTYDGKSYSPSTVTVKLGDTVQFTNQSTQPMWTASDPHPAHTDLRTFDARKGSGKGESFSYTFTTKGTHKYHNHLLDSHTGTVIVE